MSTEPTARDRISHPSAAASLPPNRRRCVRHGLAVGPDNQCVICHRESKPIEATPTPWTSIGLGLLVVITLSIAGAVAAVVTRRRSIEPERVASVPTLDVTAERVPTKPLENVVVEAPATGAQPSLEPVADVPRSMGSVEGSRSATEAVRIETVGSVTTTVNATRVPTTAELGRALRSTPITLYATSWCPACKRTRDFLSQQGLSYREIDVDRQPNGWAVVFSLAGRKSVPVIVVDGTALSGFSADEVMAQVTKSIERRLGITGLRVERR